jgi:hypothetical protein
MLASTPCEELCVVINEDDMHKFAFIREKKATKQKNNQHVSMATTSYKKATDKNFLGKNFRMVFQCLKPHLKIS